MFLLATAQGRRSVAHAPSLCPWLSHCAPSGLPTFSPMAEHENQRDEDGEQCEYEEEDLPEAVGALALHLARATVDDDLIDLFMEAVRADVDREQEVFEGDGRVVGRDLVDALLVAADVMAHVRFDDGHGLPLR